MPVSKLIVKSTLPKAGIKSAVFFCAARSQVSIVHGCTSVVLMTKMCEGKDKFYVTVLDGFYYKHIYLTEVYR